MNNKYIIFWLITLVVVVAGCNSSNIADSNNQEMEKTEDTIMKEQEKTMMGKVLAGSKTPYMEYNKEDYDKALAEGKTILLYFYADWCPICKAEQKATFAAFNELDLDNVVGFRVNYKDSATDDNEVELAKKYGISYQHTKVILKDGKQALKAPDSWDKDRYITEITKYA